MPDEILVLVGCAALDEATRDGQEVSRARQLSLWRALCHLGRVVRIEVAHDPVQLPACRSIAPKNLAQELSRIVQDDPGARIILAGNWVVGAAADILPAGAQAILAPPSPQPEHLRDGFEIWVRSRAERDHLADGREADRVHIVPDACEPAPLPAAPVRTCTGILARGPLGDEDMAWLGDRVAAEPGRMFLATRDLLPHLSPDLRATALLRDSPEHILNEASQIIVLGPPGYLALLRTTARLNTREIKFRPDAPGAAEETNFDPVTCLAAVAQRLDIALPGASDVAMLGERLCRNLDLDLETSAASYQPWTGLIHIVLSSPNVYPADLLTGHFETRDLSDGDMVNAWVRPMTPYRADLGTSLRATVALAPGVAPAGISVVVNIWGVEAHRHDISTDLVTESAGLIAIEHLGPEKVEVTAWGPPGGLKIQVGTKIMAAGSAMDGPAGPAGYRLGADWPFNRESLTPMPASGRALAFRKFAAIAAPALPSSHRLADMKDRYAGQSAWLVGNGPSVRIEDLDRLAETGALCFGFNRFHLAYDQTSLRPAFTVTGDAQMIEDFGQQIVDEAGGTVFVAHHEPPELQGDYIWLRQRNAYPSLFSLEPAGFVTPGGSSLFVAMQIGFYLGIRRWNVYGADFSFRYSNKANSHDAFRTATGDDNHFIKNYRSGRAWCPPAIESILPGFHAARVLMELNDGYIRNATRGGHLHVFDRIGFEDAVGD
jgi:hypothetical protein